MTRTRSKPWRDSVIVVVFALVSAAVIFGLLYDVIDGALRRWTERDLTRRAHLIEAAVAPQIGSSSSAPLEKTLETLRRKALIAGVVVCGPDGSVIAATGIPFSCRSPLALQGMKADAPVRARIDKQNVAVTAHSIGHVRLFVLQDRAFLDGRRQHVLRMMFVGAELAVLALLLLARAAMRSASRRTEEEARAVVRRMRTPQEESTPVPREFRLLARDVRDTVEQLRIRKLAPDTGATRLREFALGEIADRALIVVANREPYAHVWQDDGTARIDRPASGLVSGVEPLLRACGGTWIANASGSADRAFSDPAGCLPVPPGNPEYMLRRLWIDDEQYERYYSGLANEGLWPLCHMAHAQPAFRPNDWLAYQSVNETFAHAAIEQAARDDLLLIQDYHFALLPRIVRTEASHLVTSLFWHIPWPNPDVVAIFPWKEDLLRGMTGANIVGFHTRQYCLNFLATVQRYLECRVDFDDMSVTHGGHRTLVRPYPISVEWPYPTASREQGAMLRRSLGIGEDVHVSIAIDRADYTKGLIERIAAVEHLLEQNPSLIGEYVLVQLASPTRSTIRRYRRVAEELREEVDRVNRRFETRTWKPILLNMRTFSPDEVRVAYAMADSALVTPLHDGMNLVAKEYVAACGDGDGVLVLSTFAGAAKELDGALLVNPYGVEQFSDAILRAIRMPLAERRSRMHAMRDHIATNSIHDWSRKLIGDMCEARRRAARFWPEDTAARDLPRRQVVG